MATCFGPLAPELAGRPPRSRRPARVRARPHTCSRALDSDPRRLTSTYRSFRDSNEDDLVPGEDNRVCKSTRCKKRPRRHVDTVLHRRSFAFEDEPVRGKKRSQTDGYYSDTTLLPGRGKPFLSTFKSDDHEFEYALLTTLREKSKSSQNLSDAKKPRLKPLAVPPPKVGVKRTVTFSEPPPPPPPCKFSVLKSELPSLTFEQMRNAANTRHPKALYSTRRYTDLHLTIFAGNECLNPPIRVDEEVQQELPRLRTETVSGSLRRPKPPRQGTLFRSRSDGNLAKQEFTHAQTSAPISKFLRVISGSWRNLINIGGMSRPPKSTPMAKKVAPPAVPDVFRHSGSSFGSAGYSSSEDGFIPLPAPDGHTSIIDQGDVYGVPGKSPGPGGNFTYASFTFPGKGMYHHQNLQEDQGIDMTQSPGRDSPGSSGSGSGSGSGSRHSTASLDSGRASGSHLLGPRAPGSTLSSSPRCSLSSSSIGSSELGGPGGRVERLIHQGVPDHDIVHAWLQDLHFEEYFALFASAGYDMPTISRMTPEDLTAIGIKKPNHRKKLKAEIANLSISDGLPDYIPGSMDEWLKLLRLEEYAPTLRQQGYQTVEDVTQLAWEDLEEAGVVRLGHQKRLLLAIKRVKDIRAGKRISQAPFTHVTQAELHTPSPGVVDDHVTYMGGHLTQPRAHYVHHPWDAEAARHLISYWSTGASTYGPDIVPIKIRGGRGKSLESLEDGERTASHHTFSPDNTATFYYPTLQVHPSGWRRSYDDGDITPTNDSVMALHEGGGTLPRPRGLVRPRPVAKIPATRSTTHYCEKPSYNIYDMKEFNTETLKNSDVIQSETQLELQEKVVVPPSMAPITGLYDYKYRYSVTEPSHLMQGSPGLRRRPPSPPKRQSSHSDSCQTNIDCNPSKDKDNRVQTTVELHTHASIPLPTYDEASPTQELSSHLETLHIGWRNDAAEEEEQQLIAALAQQARNGSDASFKSSSSTESDSLPFANENAGTIKQRARCQASEYQDARTALGESCQEPADVLSDIGNMLANLTDELDAMLEEEKRQGLNVD